MPAEDLPAHGARLSLPKPPDHSSPGNPAGGAGLTGEPCVVVYIYSALRKEQLKLPFLNKKKTKNIKKRKKRNTPPQASRG